MGGIDKSRAAAAVCNNEFGNGTIAITTTIHTSTFSPSQYSLSYTHTHTHVVLRLIPLQILKLFSNDNIVYHLLYSLLLYYLVNDNNP